MSSNPDFDRWYAARHMREVLRPEKRLETFGSTLINYSLVSELADHPGKVRVREGRLEAHPPRIIVPHLDAITAEGFGEEAKQYLEFLKLHEKELRILCYGCHLRRDNFSEQILTGTPDAIAHQVVDEVRAKATPRAAVLIGEDEPWDVSIIELWRREVVRSARGNVAELRQKGGLFKDGEK
ncbi:MAG TPA: hypothetical protein DDY72_03750 [Verrucomicrobia bacterium]|nr:hypothetical protein [Verrucomicrobiota bacterium]